jgi:hypothetical protein
MVLGVQVPDGPMQTESNRGITRMLDGIDPPTME